MTGHDWGTRGIRQYHYKRNSEGNRFRLRSNYCLLDNSPHAGSTPRPDYSTWVSP